MNRRKPAWLKTKLPASAEYKQVKSLLRELGLHTVCEEAGCPNLGDCWGKGTATFMILWDVCTRNCKFCSVTTGNPKQQIKEREPDNVAEAVSRMSLNYVVLTSVDRDDLPDYGAAHFQKTIQAIKSGSPDTKVEALIPDFQGCSKSLKKVVKAEPETIGHNIEVVEGLTPEIRDHRASYKGSLEVLRTIKEMDSSIYTKSSIILGLGESEEEVIQAMRDLRMVQVDFLTMGQYLQPTDNQVEVNRYVRPEEFEYYRREGERMGFKYVVSGPLVRSSYRAGEFYDKVVRTENP